LDAILFISFFFFLQQLANQYETAKKVLNYDFLGKFKTVHRKGRMCVDPPEEKEKIRKFIIKFKNQLRSTMFYKAFHEILNYVERFGSTDPIGRVFKAVIPSLMSDEILNSLGSEEPEDSCGGTQKSEDC
jgi:hypothetical protein